MKLHHFIVDAELSLPTVVIKDKEVLHRIADVLKLLPGEEVVLSDGKGMEVVGIIVGPKKNGVEVKIVDKRSSKGLRKVILCCAMLKRDSFEWAVQKATEVGATEIMPLITERTIKTGLQRSRVEKIIKEAAEQSGKSLVPILHDPVKFEEVLKIEGVKIFFDFCDERFKAGDSVGSRRGEPLGTTRQQVMIFIGPEGGWTPREKKLAEDAGCLVRSLGATTMRAETAATIATYLIAQNI